MSLLKRSGAKFLFTPTGNRKDDELLAIVSEAEGGLTQARNWRHYLLCPSEQVQAISELVERDGWTASCASEHDPPTIIVERSDWTVDPANVMHAREYFERVASSTHGVMYDGWETEV